MFVDLDWPTNASSPLSASAELLVFCCDCNWKLWVSSRRWPGYLRHSLWCNRLSKTSICQLDENCAQAYLKKLYSSYGYDIFFWIRGLLFSVPSYACRYIQMYVECFCNCIFFYSFIFSCCLVKFFLYTQRSVVDLSTQFKLPSASIPLM